MLSLAAAGPSAYWYLTRGTGAVALILLTLSVALGVANLRRVRTDHVPRFVLDAVHRNVSLLAMAFLLVHIVTSVLDTFAPISLVNAVIPFTGSYRPLWLGFGAVAFDLMIAITVTSLLRQAFGYRAWRITHWAAYASWPVALLHSVGTGSDTKAGWMLVIVGGCVIVTVVAIVGRATAGWPDHPLPRVGAVGAAAIVPLGLIIWLPSGPLAKGWAKKAGTPASILRAATGSSSSSSKAGASASSSSAGSSSGSAGSGSVPFTASATGTVRQGPLGNGVAGVDISLTLADHELSNLAVHLRGAPIAGGGLQMTSSEVTLGTTKDPVVYRGHVTGLQGTDLTATLTDAQGRSLNLVARLTIDQASGAATGTVSVTR